MITYILNTISIVLVIAAIVYPVISIIYAKKIDDLNNLNTKRYGLSFLIIRHRFLQFVVLIALILMFHDSFYEYFSWLPRGGHYEDGVYTSYRQTAATLFAVITAFPLAFTLLIFVPSLIVSRDNLIETVNFLENGEREKEFSRLRIQLDESRKRIEALEIVIQITSVNE